MNDPAIEWRLGDRATPNVVRLIRTHDWGTTSLGTPMKWPPRLQHLVELIVASPLPQFVLCGADATILYNDRFADLCGARHPAMFGRPLRTAAPDIWNILGAHIYELARGSTIDMPDLRWPGIAGENGFSFDLVATPVREGRKGFAWFLGQIANVRRDDHQELVSDAPSLSEERLRLSVEIGRIATWDWDMRSGRIVWSDEHFRMEGYSPGEVEPSYESWRARVHPDDLGPTEAALSAARDAAGRYEHEFRFVHPDGTIVWSAAFGRFFYDEDGRPTRMVGAMRDVTAGRQAAETQEVMIGELQHRTRNLVGIVSALFRKTLTRSTSLSDFEHRFEQRLEALARVQGLLSTLAPGERVTFDELLRAELSALGSDRSDHVVLEGPAGVRLRSSTVQTLALAIHELATNAFKYGALRDSGDLSVRWKLIIPQDRREALLEVEWRETGVYIPEPDGPARGGGYGRELIERALPYQLNAKTSFEIGTDGVRCTISLPVSNTNLNVNP